MVMGVVQVGGGDGGDPRLVGGSQGSIVIDAGLVRDGARHYFAPDRLVKKDGATSYQSALPLSIAPNDTGVRHGVPLFISDDLEQQRRACRLRLFVRGLVDADRFTVYLNDQSVMAESCRRYFHDTLHPEIGRWMEFALAAR